MSSKLHYHNRFVQVGASIQIRGKSPAPAEELKATPTYRERTRINSRLHKQADFYRPAERKPE